MKRIYISLLLVCFVAAMSSCTREVVTPIVKTTPPALQVTVLNASGTAYPNATVKLYTDEASWTAETAPAVTRQTGADGKLVFTKEELKNPGYFYLVATDASLKVKAKTPYLILNDGKTNFNISLK